MNTAIKYIGAALVLVLFYHLSFSQYYSSGQEPSKVKWNQINTENFQIIYPVGFDAQAQRLANAMELGYIYVTKTLNHQPKKISIILHNFSSVSNAFVAWAPKRMEFFTIPGQDIYPQDWLDQLAIHEFRHVVQIDKLEQGFTKIVSLILGQQGTAAVLGLFVPFWFIEGDAVCTETAFSNTGRGRIPEFEMLLRTQVIGRKIYSYEKEYFGSYKDYVPDYYKMGYYLVAQGRKKYGLELWDHTLNYVARHPFLPTPFSKGIKRRAGLSKWQFYKETFEELDGLWKKQRNEISYTGFKNINAIDKKVYTNYRFPQYLNDSTIVALKSGLADIQQYVLLNKNGKEKTIFTPGYFEPVWISARHNSIVWTEYGFDKRWTNRIYSNIIIYDAIKGKRRRLTNKKFLFSPCLSPDASKIVAAEVEYGYKFSLVIIDVKTGAFIKKIRHPDNEFFLTPRWSEDGRTIIACVLGREGKAILMIDTEKETFKTILPYSSVEVSQPEQKGKYIFYHGTYSGIDNIYVIDTLSKEIFQVTSSVYGSFDPCISNDGKQLLYSDYTSLGFNVSETDLDPSKWIPLANVTNNSVKLYQTLSKQEGGPLYFDSVNVNEYPVKRYRKFPHLLNIHSWAPVFVNTSNTNLNPGINILSQNKLSTAVASVGYQYNYNERTGTFAANISYKALYPVLDFTVSSGQRASSMIDTSGVHSYSWHENRYALQVSQPLNFTRGKYSRGITPSATFSLKEINNELKTPSDFFAGNITTAEFNLSAYRLRKVADRDMRPKWGQVLTLNYKIGLKRDFDIRNLFAAQVSLLFPGVLKHHSLLLSTSCQYQSSGVYNFSSPISTVRGFHLILNSDQLKKVSIDYKFPLLYPDLRLGPVLYLQRVKINLFYDFASINYGTIRKLYTSTGIEVTNDLHLLNFFAPLNLGLRYSYLPQYNSYRIDFILGVNFFGL